MAREGTWRKIFFKPGKKYKVLKNWSCFGSKFTAGNVVIFESCGYERYDSETMFRFYREGESVADLIWRLRDNEDDSLVQEYFSEI